MSARALFACLACAAAGLAQNTLPLPASGNVTLPLDDYNKLVELAGKPAKMVEAPPLPYVVKSAQMDLQVKGESISGTVVLEGEVFTKGTRKVPLVTGMTVLDARQQGSVLPIEQEGGGHLAVLPGPAEFAVTLETGLALSIEPGRASFKLPAPAAGYVTLILSVPGEQTLVDLSPGLITGRSSKGGLTIIEATLVPGQSTNVWWAARNSAPAPVTPKEARFLSDVKTLISVSDRELSVAALAEVTVVQGEPAGFELEVPDGYEVTGATGSTLSASEVRGKAIMLWVSDPAARTHEFLVSLARANTAAKATVPLASFRGTQRETGEVLVEGEGAIELRAEGSPAGPGGLRRMDLREASPYLRALAHSPLHAAFRYQKKTAETPAVALEWVRFPDSAVLAAVAQEAVVTTLVTSEGRSLTEVKLRLKNHAQPFLKVALPAGASILSCAVAGEKVKPVEGADGNRVPLLRPGFRPADSYEVSFVFLHAGAPFEKKGAAELTLPRMDVPIGLLEWELFLPQQYKVADFGGEAIAARLLPPAGDDAAEEAAEVVAAAGPVNVDSLAPGQVGGLVTDPTGAVVPRVGVAVLHTGSGVTRRAVTDGAGRWLIADVPSGHLLITFAAMGFQTAVHQVNHDANRGSRLSVALQVGAVSQTVEVTGANVMVESQQVERNARQNAASAEPAASANVMDLQKRVVGVLPIAVSVPRTGNSYRFVRPLVVDEETKLTFSYRSK
jgi:hypothetical protein